MGGARSKSSVSSHLHETAAKGRGGVRCSCYDRRCSSRAGCYTPENGMTRAERQVHRSAFILSADGTIPTNRGALSKADA